MADSFIFARQIKHSRLHDEIVSILQKQILTGALTPGTRLPPERELAESLKVNRATVREALRKLELLELLEIRHGDGVYVRDLLESSNLDLIKIAIRMDESSVTLLNAMEVRRIAVPEIAYLAAQRRTKADLDELEHVIFSEDLTMLERDIRVHQMIARATHNLLCIIGLNFFTQLFREYGHLYFNDERNVSRSRAFHKEIFKAIQHQKPEDARRIMLDVLQYAEEAVRDALTDNQEKRTR